MVKAKVLGSVSDTALYYGGKRFLPFILMDANGQLYMRKLSNGNLTRFSDKAILQTCGITNDELDVFKSSRGRQIEGEVDGQ